MIRSRYMRILSVVVCALALLLSGLVDQVSARGRGKRGHYHRSHGFGRYGGHHYHSHYWYYPFWSFHYYAYPFWFYDEEPYGSSIRYRALNFRLPGFFHYPGAIGKGEITPQNSEGQAEQPVPQEMQQK